MRALFWLSIGRQQTEGHGVCAAVLLTTRPLAMLPPNRRHSACVVDGCGARDDAPGRAFWRLC